MEYLRLLFWLKWKLMLRGYRRSASASLGAVLAILIFLPLAVAIAAMCLMAFLRLDAALKEHLLRGVLLGIYLFWLLTPLLGYALNESYDITKLFLYPLSVRQIFTGAILGSLVDFPILFVLPTLAAVLVGFTPGPVPFLLILIPLALFLFHTLSMSQALLLASSGMLRSRRFRDVMIVLVPLFWMSYYVATQTLSRQMVRVDWASFLRSRAWEAISFLPPGLAARAIAAAGRDEYLASLAFLLGLAVCTVGTVYLAGWLLQKVYEGEVDSFRIRQRPPATGDRPDAATARLRARRLPSSPLPRVALPPVVEAVLEKEGRYLTRDPAFKVALMNLVYMLFVAAFVFLRPSRHDGFREFGPGMAWGATGWVLLSETQLLFNLFGTDGAAASVLFLFPSSRRQILIGKNLALLAALSAVNLVFMAVLAALAGALRLFGPLFCWMELALIVCIGVGNLVSIWFPFRVVMRGWRMRQQAGGRGCGYSFLYLSIAAGAALLLLPILAALLLPAFWIETAWFALTVPLAAAYAFGLYALSLRMAEPLLLQREVEIVAKLAETE